MKLASKIWIFLFVLLVLAFPLYKTYQTHARTLPVFGLWVPEGQEHALATRLWLKAAEEEGVPLTPISEDEVTDPFQMNSITAKAILIPDEIAQNASSTLVSFFQTYVNKGGRLILVGDALMHNLSGRLKETFPAEMVFGFPALQGRVGDTIQLERGTIRLTDDWKNKLQIPPGQYSPPDSLASPVRELCTYQALHAKYPHYKTAPNFSGTRILESGDGSLIAGTKKIGKGEVLWINLPLSFLKRRTDGMLMHAFLRWISEDWLGLPRLLSVPNGKGGIVLNVHVDSNAALPYLDKLKNEGFFSDGPFSIHITAGPDAREPGDGLGFDLPKNKKSQEWVRYFIKHGHQVGSHGGWIHDYFGLHLTEKETPEFKDDLEKNYEAIKKAAGSAPVEYSAPLGNQPIWVNSWLRNRGYQSYYFVGDNGMGPTQNFRDTEFTDRGLWSFPVASYLQAASFEEADDQKIPEKEFTSWLIGLSHYVADHQNARLFYFHPPGIRFYVGALARWRKENRELIHQHRFEWYTMAGLTQFLNARTEVVWKIDALKVEHEFELSAKGCDKLHEMVWRFPKKTIKNVKVVSGHAQVTEKAQTIEVQPEDDHEIKVQYEEVQDAI